MTPLWKLTYYSGLTFDWCRPIQRGRLSTIVHLIVILFSLLALLCLFIKFGFELVITMKKGSPLQDILLLLVVSCDLPMTLTTWTTFLVRRKSFLAFFHDWKQLEKQLHIVDGASIKIVSTVIYLIYFSLSVAFLLSNILEWVINEDVEPWKNDHFLLYINPDLVETSHVVFIGLLNLLSSILMVIFIALVDIAPSLVYYHSSKMIKSLENEILQFNQERAVAIVQPRPDSSLRCSRVQSIWLRFEQLRSLISRADDLFGPIIILNHGIMFFITCTMAFSLFQMIRNPFESAGFSEFLTTLFFFSLRFELTIAFMSKVHISAGHLVSAVGSLSAKWCNSADSNEQRIIQSFLVRIQSIHLAAHPSGFYKITPSILLTLLSLIISYIIILLQQAN